jgi:hypothetical protein
MPEYVCFCRCRGPRFESKAEVAPDSKGMFRIRTLQGCPTCGDHNNCFSVINASTRIYLPHTGQ